MRLETPVAVRLCGPDDTERLGAALAPLLRRGEAILLSGGLGAGKSTLARGLIRALTRPDEEAPSPTFTLVQTYQGPAFPIAHFDLYRIERPEELIELGMDEALDEGAIIVEWPDRADPRAFADRLDIEIADAGEGRLARITAHGAFRGRTIDY